MNLCLTEHQQHEMRYAYYDGAPGIMVSGLVWLVASIVTYQMDMHTGVWTLLIGGALIHPIGTLVDKVLGRPSKTSKENALTQLAMASTIWLILCCAMAYGLYHLNPALFFPAMMATIGSRYLVFATLYGRGIYWLFGGCLLASAYPLFALALQPALVAGICGFIELLFAILVFAKASKEDNESS